MAGLSLPLAPAGPDGLPLALLRALAEPTRLELVLALAASGERDIEAIAAEFPQDRSVISRHLSTLHAAGALRRRQEGRRVLYQLDGPALLSSRDALSAQVRTSMAGCCGPEQVG